MVAVVECGVAVVVCPVAPVVAAAAAAPIVVIGELPSP